MKTIRKSRAKENETFVDSAVIDIEHGAHLKIKSVRIFPPKFHEGDDSLWKATISARMVVVDDHTEDGLFDGAEFNDTFELKMDLDVLEELGLDDKDLKDAEKSDFSKQQRAAILDEDNWTIRDNTKADKLNITLFGKNWDNKDFHPDLWVDKEFVAKVYPRTGKRAGSYCGWDTFVSLTPPEKKKGIRKAQEEAKAVAQAANDAEIEELASDEHNPLLAEEEKQSA